MKKWWLVIVLSDVGRSVEFNEGCREVPLWSMFRILEVVHGDASTWTAAGSLC